MCYNICMNFTRFLIFGSMLTLILISRSFAAMSLPFVFSNDMVLQRDKADPVWGSAPEGTHVTVKIGSQEKSVTADKSGDWMVKLDPMPANAAGQSLTVSDGTDTLVFNNVLIGEVWLASGQSNMEKPIGDQRGQFPTVNAKEEIARADHPLIRLLTVPKVMRAKDIRTHWEVCTPATIQSEHFSAAAYFFGRKIQQELNVPVGLIHSSWGGTRIEPWTNPQGFDQVPSLGEFAPHGKAGRPTTRISGAAPSALYNAMIEPLVPFGIRGAIWYQGESNVMAHDRSTYFDKMRALIGGWRQVWGEGDFPFYFVQLAPYTYTTPKTSTNPAVDLPAVWEAQLKTLSIPNTGMAVITDLVDDVHNIHPIRKREVGDRLALWALAKDYGKSNLVFSGPLEKSVTISGHEATVHFDFADGLATRDGKSPTDFLLAGTDGTFVPADAKITGQTVVVSSPDVPAPQQVRLGGTETAMPNLVNGAGLPASPFTSDATP
jgi:sialate O-acetylesterase